MMKKNLFIITLITLISIQGFSKEGMWIPSLLKNFVTKDMQDMGMRLTAEEIYSINQASLKDAIVIFGGGCTGELVSNEGLLLTNHHCGYGNIQYHSSVKHDYLTDGFWAMNKEEELPNPGLKATFLIRINDVTDLVMKNVEDDMSEIERKKIISKNIKEINKDATNESHYKAVTKPFYYGNEYYQFIYEEFLDVRLVGAPPSNIGKFGGDTDNWMWPRHTGDFSVFRIYADKNNHPAKYSKENVPYHPKKHLKVSLKGVEKDDFTFVFGYPGTTEEYLPSYAIDNKVNIINPIRINMRTEKLRIMNKHMNEDTKTRIQYAAKNARTANGWKKWQGENRGIKRLNAIEKKKDLEKRFQHWLGNIKGKSVYNGIIDDFQKIYTDLKPFEGAKAYLTETIYGIEITSFANQFKTLVKLSTSNKPDKNLIANKVEVLKEKSKNHFKDYNPEVDREIMVRMLEMYYNQPEKSLRAEYIVKIGDKYNGNFKPFVDKLFKKSIFSSEEKTLAFLDEYKSIKNKKIRKDPAYALSNILITQYVEKIAPSTRQWNTTLDSLQRVYIRGLKEFQKDKLFYPDANFTLRVTYGKVQGYEPADGVVYNYYTTLQGVMEKENPEIYDYVVEPKLKELYNNRNYGKYANNKGNMPVCFIASNHTSGGNSGSPVLDADGHLIGINFDRNWEGTMSDLMYDPDMCRNITLDIRYCLFIIDKFAGAKHLVDEMTLITE